MTLRHRLGAAAAVLLVATAAGSATAAPDPIAQVQEVLRDGAEGVDGVIDDLGGNGFPPHGFAVTTVQWSMAPGDAAPTFTPPGPASHPLNWACSTSVSATTAHASCQPIDPPDPGFTGWHCYDPYVVVDIQGGVSASPTGAGVRIRGGQVTGTAACGESVARCTADTGLGLATTTVATDLPAAHCQDWAFPHQPVPLVCDADFAAAVGTTWSVRCAPIDP